MSSLLRGMFPTVVHNAPPEDARLHGMFSTMVHNAPSEDARLHGMISTIAYQVPPPQAICPDITGTTGVPATFDGSASVQVEYYRWSWVSVPGGSSFANSPIPFPDNQATSPIDMANNVGLWHFDTVETVSIPTGSIGLFDTYGDGWHNNNFVNVSVNGTVVLSNITLPSGSGPLWFDYTANVGDTVSVSFSGGSFPNECQYLLNDSSGGTGTTFYTSPTNPTTTYNFTAPVFGSVSTLSTPDTSGSGNVGVVNGATQVSGQVGSHAFEFDGNNDRIEIGSAFAYTTEDFSISFWVKEGASQSGFTNIFGNQSSQKGFCLEASSSGGHSYRMVTGDGGWTFGSSVALTPGAWTHLAITRSGSTIIIYKDGVLAVSDSSFPATITAATIPMWIGANESSGRYWSGTLDEFAIWERALSASEVSDIYAGQDGSLAGIGTSTFTFTPDVVGTFTINLAVTDVVNTNADCVVTAPSGGSSEPQGHATQGGSLQGHKTQGLL